MTPLMIAFAVSYATTGIVLAAKLPEIRRKYNTNKFRKDCYQKMVELIMTNPDNYKCWSFHKLTKDFSVGREYEQIKAEVADKVLADMEKDGILYRKLSNSYQYSYIKY